MELAMMRHGHVRALVAVARKLAVVLHRIWVTRRNYDPNFKTAAA
ncbi:MAG TPA: hypothetical protein VFP65_02005 [Anaeromyxobacteraceae bacterium]|nr:hypothetical protein [Anaeromyxobacteraceae bacterium]